MSEPIPVTLRDEYTWRAERPPWELCNILNAIAVPDFRTIREGAVEKVGLDTASRRKQDNLLKFAPDAQQRINQSRKINKALAMELVMASLLTHIDHPREVKSFCAVNREGLPHYFAPALAPDIVVQPADNEPPFQIVCEVSANREMSDGAYLGQLEETLRHARDMHELEGADVTYGLVANLRKIGADKRLQKVLRQFLTDPDNGLEPWGPIRIVPIRAPELGTAVRRLDAEDKLAFDSRILARALDALHEKWWQEDVPEEEDWMAGIFLDAVTGGIADEKGLLGASPGP